MPITTWTDCIKCGVLFLKTCLLLKKVFTNSRELAPFLLKEVFANNQELAPCVCPRGHSAQQILNLEVCWV